MGIHNFVHQVNNVALLDAIFDISNLREAHDGLEKVTFRDHICIEVVLTFEKGSKVLKAVFRVHDAVGNVIQDFSGVSFKLPDLLLVSLLLECLTLLACSDLG